MYSVCTPEAERFKSTVFPIIGLPHHCFLPQFLGDIAQGPRGVYPCLGMVGKTNGNFVIEVNSEKDVMLLCSRSGGLWNGRRLNCFRYSSY